jgi:hypothetical protein
MATFLRSPPILQQSIYLGKNEMRVYARQVVAGTVVAGRYHTLIALQDMPPTVQTTGRLDAMNCRAMSKSTNTGMGCDVT